MLNDTTLALYIIKLIDVLEESNVYYRGYLNNAGITAQELSNRNARLSVAKYLQFVESVVSQHDIPDLGFRVGRHTNILEHGVLGYALLSSAVLEESLQRYIRYQHLVGPILQVGFTIENGRGCLTAAPKVNGWRLSNRALCYFVQEWLSTWVEWNQLVGVKKAFLNKVELGFQPEGSHDIYRDHLRCEIKVDGCITRAWFSAEYLERPLEYGDKVIGTLCAEQCERLLEAKKLKQGFTAEVTWRLANSPGCIPDMESMAGILCISSRTLRRHLRDEGTVYQQVILDFKMAMAKHYLTETLLPANEIANIVGYANTANFYRIFLREVGCRPQQFRDDTDTQIAVACS